MLANGIDSWSDASTTMDFIVGYDSSLNLVIVLKYTGYVSDHDCYAYTVIKKDDAYTLARCMNVSMVKLPEQLTMAASAGFRFRENLDPRYVRECFDSAITLVAAYGVPHRVVSVPDARGRRCYK